MYKPIVEIIVKDLETQKENAIIKAIQNIAINIDKEELQKALNYDRNSYNNGYIDGFFDFRKKVLKRLDYLMEVASEPPMDRDDDVKLKLLSLLMQDFSILQPEREKI